MRKKLLAALGCAALAGAVLVPVKGAPEDGPVPVALHAHRRPQPLFRGGQDVVHVLQIPFLSPPDTLIHQKVPVVE